MKRKKNCYAKHSTKLKALRNERKARLVKLLKEGLLLITILLLVSNDWDSTIDSLLMYL